MLSPVFGVVVFVTDSLHDPNDRLVACEVLHICSSVITIVYCDCFFFSLVFRWVLIKFPDRGLVIQGRPNLGLFNQLFWIAFGSCFFFFFSIFVAVPFVTGTFEQSNFCRKCMIQPFVNDNKAANRLMIIDIFFLITSAYMLMIRFKVTKYFSGVCPKGHMSAIGKYQRNLVSFKENCKYIYIWDMYALYMSGGAILKFMNVSPKVNFWYLFGGKLAVVWFIHGLVLPLSMTIPWKSQTLKKVSHFYVTQPIFPPDLPLKNYCPAAPHGSPCPFTRQILHSPSIWTKNDESNISTLVIETPSIILFSPSEDRIILVQPAFKITKVISII